MFKSLEANKNRLVFIVTFLMSFSFYSQNKEDTDKKFDSVYFYVATNLAGKDIDKAFRVSDSLFQTSVSDIQKVKSLMLSSSLHQQKGESEEAIILASKAEEIAEKSRFYEWQARISGFLSTQYRNIDLTERGKVYLDKGLKASKRLEEGNQKNLYLGMVYQEIAYYDIKYNDFGKAEESVKMAEDYFQKLPDGPQTKYFIATNYQLYGRVFLKCEKYDSALEYYQKALENLEGITEENALVNGFIYGGIGNSFFELNNYSKAKEYLEKAETIALSSDNANLKLEVYEVLSEYYKITDDYKNHSLYREKYIETHRSFEDNKKKTVDNLLKSLELDNKYLSDNSFKLKIGIGVLLFLGFGSIVFYQLKKKKDSQKFKTVIERLTQEIKVKESLLSKNEDKESEEQEDVDVPKKTVNISEKKEKEIIEGLKEFEHEKGFLERNVSLSILAGSLNTNTIYVSYILNNRYNKDFNAYINELRIRYIVHQLKGKKDYRRFKIGYLAEECGFSSHSKFSAIFKSVTGFSPSIFIDYLDKNNSE